LGQSDQDELALLPNPDELEQMLEDKEEDLVEGEFDADKVDKSPTRLCFVIVLYV
jgi:hypothetical protein